MKRFLNLLESSRPAIIGSAGTGATVLLDRVHVSVGILVGCATFIYLCIKIWKELRK